MKSLNRTLSLVLVLVMVFGLFGVASASFSTYTDAASVGAAYAEAVDVMTGLGIVNGTTATTLDPTGSYTREQAAKVVAYIALGKTTADALACSAAPFTDVAASRWSAGYIQYAVSQGIINGMGDGTFNPTGALTGYQFAKMLLCALGYGKASEYTGAGWEIAVAKDALGLKIFKGDTTAATNSVISRQQAMLMAFNAMFKATATPTYQWDNGVRHVTDYDDTGASYATLVYGYNADNGASDASAPALAKVFTTVNGVYGHYWYYKSTSTPISAFYSDETVIGTSTNGKSIDTLSYDSNANSYFIAAIDDTDLSGTDATLEIYHNGTPVTSLSTAEGLIGLGVKVVFVDTDDDTDTAEKIYITTYDVAVLSAAPSVKTSTVNGKNYVYVNFVNDTDIGTSTIGDYSVLASNVTGYTGLVKGDVVLVTKMESGTYTLTKAATFTGSVTASSGTSLTIGGTTYKAAEDADGTITGYSEGFLNSVAFYTDTTGYLVYADAVTAASTDYLYIVDVDTFDAATTFEGATNLCYVTFETGATATITVESIDGDVFADGDISSSEEPVAGEIYSYAKNTDGTYALTSETTISTTMASSSADGLGAITKGSTSLKNSTSTVVKANSATVFAVRNIKTAASTAFATTYYSTWTVYTGYASVPTLSDATFSAVDDNGDGYAETVFVYYYTTEAATDTSVIYLLDTTATAVYKSTGVDYYTFPAIVDGVKTVVKAPASINGSIESLNAAHALGSIGDGTLLAVSYSDGKLSGVIPVTSATLGNATFLAYLGGAGNYAVGTAIKAPVSNVIEIGDYVDDEFVGVGYNYTSTTVVFYISADFSTVTMDVAANLSDDDYVLISAVTMAAGEDDPTTTQQNTLKAIFVQAQDLT